MTTRTSWIETRMAASKRHVILNTRVRWGVVKQHAVRMDSGYTLVELMITVAIVGVLSAIAVPTFTMYMYKSKTTEAIGFLAEIKQRQESYRAEFGQYCNVSGTPATTWPLAALDFTPVAWGTPPAHWTQLGASPDSFVRFRYSTVAGFPGTDPSGSGFAGNLGYDGSDFWFVSQATGDLDEDGTTVLIESYSGSSNVFINRDKGWE